MANYSEEFLNALSRTSSSVKGLMDTIKEPDWREKIDYETAATIRAEKSRIQTTGGEERKTISHSDFLGYAEREHGLKLNIEKGEFDDKMKRGLLDFESSLNKDEMQEANRLLLKEMKYGAKLTKKENQRLSEYKKREYEAARDADYDMEAGDLLYRTTSLGPNKGLINVRGEQDYSNASRLSKLEAKQRRVEARQAHKDELNQMVLGSNLTDQEAAFAHQINKDAMALTDYLTRGQMELEAELIGDQKAADFSNQAQLDALRSIMDLERINLDANLKMQHLDREHMYAYEEAGFMATSGLGDVDFGDITKPKDSWTFLPEDREDMGVADARAQFSGMLALYHTQIPGALKAKVVNPDSFAVKEAIRDADKAAETALNLYNFSKDQGFDDDAEYFANAIEHLRYQKDRFEQ